MKDRFYLIIYSLSCCQFIEPLLIDSLVVQVENVYQPKVLENRSSRGVDAEDMPALEMLG